MFYKISDENKVDENKVDKNKVDDYFNRFIQEYHKIIKNNSNFIYRRQHLNRKVLKHTDKKTPTTLSQPTGKKPLVLSRPGQSNTNQL